MKSMLLWLFIAIGPCFALAQTKINKSYPVNKGQTISFNFDYPKTIHISTWDRNEIAIEATVKINEGQTNQAFTLLQNSAAGKISVSNKLDMDLIPDSYHILENGSKLWFSTKQELEAHLKAKGGPRPAISYQKNISITIHIKVPANISTALTSVYGMVEVKDFNGPIKVDARYGGIDASLREKSVGRLEMTTRYGKIYSDISLKPIESIERDFFTSLTAQPGKGPGYHFTSSYGNIYLRSATK